MKSITFYQEPNPNNISRNKIEEIYVYSLTLDDTGELFVKYETDTTLPCKSYLSKNLFINETFTIKDFYNLKQNGKYKYINNAKEKLTEFIANMFSQNIQ